MTPRVLLVEDEQNLGEALEYQLKRVGFEVVRLTDGRVALERFRTSGADLVLLDLMLPGMNGEDVCREIRRGSDVPIIMLTAKGSENDRVLGLELGADDYVAKPFSTRELIARMRAVMRRSSSPPRDQVLDSGGVRLDRERFEVTVDGQPVDLPRKEFALLEILVENVGRVLTRDVLIERVWGADYFGDTRTLDVHIRRLRLKIENDPRDPKRLLTVRGLGYRFVPDAQVGP